MDFEHCDKVTAFDTLFCTNHIQMLKIMFPYLDDSMQKFLAVYIKILELKYTLALCQRNSGPLYSCERPGFNDLCKELLPCCSETEKKQLNQLRSLFQGMETCRQAAEMMELMKEFMPDCGVAGDFGANPFSTAGSGEQKEEASGSGFNMMGMLMNMLTPEQKEMFEMFGGNHGE